MKKLTIDKVGGDCCVLVVTVLESVLVTVKTNLRVAALSKSETNIVVLVSELELKMREMMEG